MMAGSATAATVLLERHDGPADLLLHVEVLESADPTCSFFVLSHNCNLLSKKTHQPAAKTTLKGTFSTLTNSEFAAKLTELHPQNLESGGCALIACSS